MKILAEILALMVMSALVGGVFFCALFNIDIFNIISKLV